MIIELELDQNILHVSYSANRYTPFNYNANIFIIFRLDVKKISKTKIKMN